MAFNFGRASQMYNDGCVASDAGPTDTGPSPDSTWGSSAATRPSSNSLRLLNTPDMGWDARDRLTLLYTHTITGTVRGEGQGGSRGKRGHGDARAAQEALGGGKGTRACGRTPASLHHRTSGAARSYAATQAHMQQRKAC
jgi:hypothetical protein